MSSTDTSDSGMYKMMGFVVIALTLFTLFCMLMARILGGHTADPTDQVMRNALIERIAPVGQIHTVGMVDSTASAEPKSGEDLYNGACAACHASGVASAMKAPMYGDAQAWATRGEVGLDALVASAIKGKGTMPGRGGSNYSDEEMQRAVKHLTGL